MALAAGVAWLAPQSSSALAKDLPQSPAPEVSAQEKDYFARLDAAMAPVLNLSWSKDDLNLVRDGVAAVRAHNMGRFNEVKAAMKDPVAAKLVDWIRLRSGYGTASEYQTFLAENPLWPDRLLMVQRLEEALFTHGGSASSIKSYFASEPPKTGIGYAALASAYLAEGNTAEAKKIAAKSWREMSIPATLETGFLRRFGPLLTEDDHKWRFDRVIAGDMRWAESRSAQAAIAKRIIPLLPAAERKKAVVRLAVFSRTKNAHQLLDSVPDDASDTGLTYHRIQVLRKAGKTDAAAKLILSVPPDPDKIAELDEWWDERRALAYQALKAGDYGLAYSLVKDAGPLSVNPLKEQTFMAGWIMFRYLKRPSDVKQRLDIAEKHFKDLSAAADGPLSRAKAAYWLGRVAEARGDKAAAREHYQTATRNRDTFHGLLALQKLDAGNRAIEITPPAFPSSAQIANFNRLDAVKAAVLAHKADLGREHKRSFFTSLRIGLPSEAEAGMIAHLAESLGDTQMALRIAKSATARGDNLLIYGYPVHPFPAYKPLREPPEMAFLLGIARQETEFSSTIVSGAGAKGLLQVMTVTAKHVCRDYKIKCEIDRLLKDNSYNAMIASAYIGDRMAEFDGSYILGLAGYNAGPGRARQWVRENGDPRDPDVDPIDWIERIPITETREYVQKVLSNIQIYRARIGNKDPLNLKADLSHAPRDGAPERGQARGEARTASDNEG